MHSSQKSRPYTLNKTLHPRKILSKQKKFDKLPAVSQNCIKFFSLIEGQDPADIDNMSPSENFLTIVDQTSPAAVQRILHLAMREAGLMVSLQPGLCLALKNGFLASDNGPSYPTNFCVFLCNPGIGPSAHGGTSSTRETISR